MNDLHRRLNDAGYICDRTFSASVAAALGTTPVSGAFLFGPTGTGKTFLPDVVAGILESDYHFYQCFPGTREEDLLVKMLPSERTVSGVELHEGVILEAISATNSAPPDGKNGDKVVLVLDEWDKTRPSADAFLLDFLQTGRVTFNGRRYQANLSRLVVFLTMNDERDMSEPLLRRLPKIDFRPLEPSLVRKALKLTHAEHPYLENAMVLYRNSLTAQLPKPVTIQELRQFLDAITTLGEEADWDNLVYQFVTKTEEAHALLRNVENRKLRWHNLRRDRLDAGAYIPDADSLMETPDEEAEQVMPKLRDIWGFNDVKEAGGKEEADLAGSYGVLENSPSAYNELVRMIDGPLEDPGRLGDLASVNGGYLSFRRPLPLHRVNQLESFWGLKGEILLIEELATWEDVKALQDWGSMKIVRFASDEILGKAEGIDLRWTPEIGAEIIVDLQHGPAFRECFGYSWGKVNEAKWIGEEGRIYRRHAAHKAGDSNDGPEIEPPFCDVNADVWGADPRDWRNDADIPLFGEFTAEACNFRRNDSWKEFKFDGIDIAFKDTASKKNDRLAVRVTGKFDGRLLPYLREWLPRGAMPLSHTFPTELRENELLRRHGFRVNPEDSRVSFRRDNGFLLTYDPEALTITVSRRLEGDSLDLDTVYKSIEQMRNLRAELS